MDTIIRLDFLTGDRDRGAKRMLERFMTGNLVVDTILAAIFPLAMRTVMPSFTITGNSSLDILVFAVFPVLAEGRHRLAPYRERLQDDIAHFTSHLFSRILPRYETVIEFEETTNSIWEEEDVSRKSSEGERNNILQKAILHYLGHLEIHYYSSATMLSAVKEKVSQESVGPRYWGAKRTVVGSTAEQLRNYKVQMSPPQLKWVLVDSENGIYFMKERRMTTPQGDDAREAPTLKKVQTRVRYTIWCGKNGGTERIKTFIDTAYDWYCETMKATEDHSRYQYNLLNEPKPSKQQRRPGLEEEDPDEKAKREMQSAPLRYQSYKLGEVKDFDSLFFPEKKNLLKILEHFQKKTGKYSIKGYPHKLGVMLHGPPGTGKTSLIKALACHTRRHIINVPLGRIKTNQVLINIMFNQKFSVLNQDMPVCLKYEDVIFVFEDVDAATPIVQRRVEALKRNVKKIKTKARAVGVDAENKGSEEATTTTQSAKELFSPGSSTATPTLTPTGSIEGTSASEGIDNGADSSKETVQDNTAVKQLDKTAEHGSTPADSTDVAAAGGSQGAGTGVEEKKDEAKKAGVKDNDNDDDGDDNDSAKKEAADETKYADKYDKLDLSGLLNALDGVVDTPGRIVVMTTNLVDKLDPALIRPGRIDKKIHLGYMKHEAALEMTRHFFQTELTDEQNKQLKEIFDDNSIAKRAEYDMTDEGQLTPAVVEQMAGEYDTVDEYLEGLRNLPAVFKAEAERREAYM